MQLIAWIQGMLAVLLVVVTVLPWSSHPAWWVRVWDFPRLQLGILALAVQVSLWVWPLPAPWQMVTVVAMLAVQLYQLWWILPYTRLWRKEVMDAQPDPALPSFRVMACNVLTTNRNAQGLIALVQKHQPDVLVTLETDQWWQDQLSPIHADYPHRVACPLDNLYGMHVFSRLPLQDTELSYLVEPDVPSIHTSVQVTDALAVRMHFLHPAPPSPTENDESTERDVELLMVAKSLAKEDGPTIVTGDLNDVAWSPTTRLFRKISRLLDPRVGRGMYNSFHAHYPFARWPLDHFFHSDHFQLLHIERLPSMGSDHFPVLLELQYHPENAAIQEGLDVDAQDHADTQELLQEEGADPNDVPTPDAKG